MFRKKLVLVALVALLVLGLQSITQGSLIAGQGSKPAFVPNEVLVNFHAGITPSDIATFYAEHGLVEKKRLGARPGQVSRLRLVQVKPGRMNYPQPLHQYSGTRHTG